MSLYQRKNTPLCQACPWASCEAEAGRRSWRLQRILFWEVECSVLTQSCFWYFQELCWWSCFWNWLANSLRSPGLGRSQLQNYVRALWTTVCRDLRLLITRPILVDVFLAYVSIYDIAWFGRRFVLGFKFWHPDLLLHDPRDLSQACKSKVKVFILLETFLILILEDVFLLDLQELVCSNVIQEKSYILLLQGWDVACPGSGKMWIWKETEKTCRWFCQTDCPLLQHWLFDRAQFRPSDSCKAPLQFWYWRDLGPENNFKKKQRLSSTKPLQNSGWLPWATYVPSPNLAEMPCCTS